MSKCSIILCWSCCRMHPSWPLNRAIALMHQIAHQWSSNSCFDEGTFLYQHTTPSSQQPRRYCSCSSKDPAYIPVDFHLRCQGTSLTQNETRNLAVGGGLKLHGSFDSVTALHCCCSMAKALLSTAISPPHRIMFVDSFSLLREHITASLFKECCRSMVLLQAGRVLKPPQLPPPMLTVVKGNLATSTEADTSSCWWENHPWVR